MRPDYIEAVDAARYGVLLFATIAAPFFMIISAFVINRFLIKELGTANRTLWLLGTMLLAYLLFVGLAITYLANIQDAREENAVTEVERMDANDSPFELLIVFPAGAIWCGFTFIVGLVGTAISRVQFVGGNRCWQDSKLRIENENENDNTDQNLT